MAALPVPLTTTFTPPSDCLASMTYDTIYGYLLLGGAASCLPSGATPTATTQTFSPAWICPSGWSSAYGNTATAAGTVTETQVMCCPKLTGMSTFTGESRMYYYSGLLYPCTAYVYNGYTAEIFSGDTSYATEVTWTPSPYTTYTYTLSGGEQTTYTYTSTPYTTLQAPVIQIAWQATDLANSGKAGATTSAPTSAAQSETGSADTDNGGSGGLSTTAKIAMGVAIPLGIIAIVAIGFFILMKRRKQKQLQRGPMREIQQEVNTHDAYDGSTVAPGSTTGGSKHASSQVGYAPVSQRGFREDHDDYSQRPPSTGPMNQSSWGSRTPELPSYAQQQQNMMRGMRQH